MDKQHEYRVATGSGAGLALVGMFAPYVWPNMSTFISYPAILIGAALVLWGLWPVIAARGIRNSKMPEISIIVGHDGHYVETKNYNIYNVTRSVLIGVKNTGSTYLSNCKLDCEIRNSETNLMQKWFREGSFSLNQGEEKYIGVASYNEPLPPHPTGGSEIQLHAPPSGAYVRPPTLPAEGGCITLIATSAESRPCEVICKLWVKDGRFCWEKVGQ